MVATTPAGSVPGTVLEGFSGKTGKTGAAPAQFGTNVPPRDETEQTMEQLCEVAIIGAGPYGISLAAQLGTRGIDYRIFGKPMDTWSAHMPKNMTLKSEGFASSLSAPHGTPRSRPSAPARTSLTAIIARRSRSIPSSTMPTFPRSLRAEDRRDAGDVARTSARRLPARARQRRDIHGAPRGAGGGCQPLRPYAGAAGEAARRPRLAQLRSPRCRQFRDKDVAIVGAGSSAIDLAHLLQAPGANPRIIARASQLSYNTAPDPGRDTLLFRLQNPPSTIGRGWRSYFCAEAPLLFYRLPRHMKERAIASHMHPAAGWFMREEVEGRIATSLGDAGQGCRRAGPRRPDPCEGRRGEEMQGFDHVIAATGYRVDLDRVPFLTQALRANIALAPGGSPFVFDNFETSVDGLYAIGLTAMEMFGPLFASWSVPNSPPRAGPASRAAERTHGDSQGRLTGPDQLVRLETQAPLRVIEAVACGGFRVGRARRIVHRLQEEIGEVEPGIAFRAAAFSCGKMSFSSSPRFRPSVASALGLTQIQSRPGGGCQRAIGLDADFEPLLVERLDQRVVELQQRFAASADDIGLARPPFGHCAVTASASAAASANRPPPGPSMPTKSVSQKRQMAVARSRSSAAPQIAAGKAQEHGRTPGPRALALQRVIDFLDRIAHRAA